MQEQPEAAAEQTANNTVDDAVDAFMRGLRSDHFEIVFPRRLAFLLRLLRRLPYPLYFRITRRLIPSS